MVCRQGDFDAPRRDAVADVLRQGDAVRVGGLRLERHRPRVASEHVRSVRTDEDRHAHLHALRQRHPLFSYDFISAFVRKTLLLETYDTLVGSVDLSTMTAVKEQYSDLKDKTMRPAWYDRLKLPPTVCKTGNGARLEVMTERMLKAYIDLFATARDIDSAVKNERNSAYVEGLINDGPTYRAVSRMIGAEDAKTLFRQCLFGTAIV